MAQLTIPLSEIEAARVRLEGAIVRTPLVKLNLDGTRATIYLKLENLQPIGSFKIRGSGNAMLSVSPGALARGVYTASAGNMAQGVAWHARRLGVRCTAIVPDHAPDTKLDAIKRLGGEIRKVPFDTWWQILVQHGDPDMDGLFIHPVSDPAVMAGNGTIGIEVLEDLPGVDAVLIPYGGGGLSCGIASAIRALKPEVRLYACEVETAAPFHASLCSGAPQEVKYIPSFVDGIGGKSVLAEMWPMASTLLDGGLTASLSQVAAAVKLLAERNRLIAEGAGATPVACALSNDDEAGTVVCVVSGGNIDTGKLVRILMNESP